MSYVLGIDGGGSTVRVCIVSVDDLSVIAESTGLTVNPRVVGRDEAVQRIQSAVQQALQEADLHPNQINGAGIGVAGAANRYPWSEPWLRETVNTALPGTSIVPSSDYEIALVGATGQRFGILLLAGTGSLAYGVNANGESALVGGWGYLIGDEGSGYWLGAQALRAAVRMADGRGPDTSLYNRLLDALDITHPLEVIDWLYSQDGPRVRDVATLAPLVLQSAAEDDAVARRLVGQCGFELALAVRAVRQRLDLPNQQPVFAGSLLTTENPLSKLVCELLGLDAIPMPKYPPVMGAALLALSANSA